MESKFNAFDAFAATFFIIAGVGCFWGAVVVARNTESVFHELMTIMFAVGGVICWGIAWLASIAAKR
jgi:hypothetical protein